MELLLLICFALPSRAGSDQGAIDEVLIDWLHLIEGGGLYLLVDRQMGEVRLYHDSATLRSCDILEDALGPNPSSASELTHRLRRYRPSHPWAMSKVGPFDWEENLTLKANEECALYFESGALIYASKKWQGTHLPSVRIKAEDLKALYDTLPEGARILILPTGWMQEQ